MNIDLIKFEKQIKDLKIDLPKITFLDVLRKVNNEEIISNWLSFLFNPKINGLGDKIAQILLDICDSNINLKEQEFKYIKREEYIEDKKRIDILIEYSKTLIVIENKIGSWENGNQTKKYFNYIEKIKQDKDVIYIYLKPKWNSSNPSKRKTNEENGFRVVCYEQLIDELKKININDYKSENRYKYTYLETFIQEGERYLKMDNEISINDEVKFYLKHEEEWKEIEKRYNNKNNNLRKRLVETIKESFFQETGIEYKVFEGKNYIQIFRENWNKNHNGMHYELLSSELNELLGAKRKIRQEIHFEINTPIKEKEQKEKLKAYYSKEKLIKEYDFTTYENIEKSINEITKELIKLDKKYGKQLDKCIITGEMPKNTI